MTHSLADSRAGKMLNRVVTGYFNYHAVPTGAGRLPLLCHRTPAAYASVPQPEGRYDLERINWLLNPPRTIGEHDEAVRPIGGGEKTARRSGATKKAATGCAAVRMPMTASCRI
jgi:hypothetical protein